jgi:hypothetical protein
LDFSGKEGIIKAENLNVRLGPGFEYSIVGTVSRGTTVRLKSDKGRDWTCVYPVSNCYGWVNKKHISKAKAIFAEEETLEESRRKIKIVLESFQPQEEEINTPDEIITQNDSNEFPLEKENDFTADEIDVEEEETINATVEDEKPEEESVSISETPGYVSVMGYIEDLGKILFRPGKYKLVDDWGNVLYYLAGKEVDLKGFIYGKVKIQGIRKNNYYHSIPILEVKKAEYINQ